MENHGKRDIDMNCSFDEAKYEWPSPRLFPCRMIQGECRRADVHSGTNRVHVGGNGRSALQLPGEVLNVAGWSNALIWESFGGVRSGYASGSVQDSMSCPSMKPSRKIPLFDDVI